MMKFKTKLKALAVALAMTAGSASAAISPGSSDNGGLFLEVYDSVSGATYIRDLGITMNNFGTANRPTGGFTSNVDTGTFASTGNGSVVGGVLTFTGDSNWTSFVSSRTPSNFVWEVLATDTVGGAAVDSLRVLYTSSFSDGVRATNPGTLASNGNILAAVGNINNQLTSGPTSINSLLGAAQSLITTTATDTAYATFLGATMGGGTGVNLNTFSAIGASSFLNYATRNGSVSGTPEAIFATYGTTSNPFPVALAADGTLTFGQVTAVPEPGTWAMMVAGLLMVGGIARRRISA